MEAKKKVMAVDDDAGILRMLSTLLHLKDFDVIGVESGELALKLLPEEKPDIILLDIIMPGMDGFEACRRVREISTVPIIMVTAKYDKADIVHGFELGADDYVIKPFNDAELTARIRGVLKRYDAKMKRRLTDK